MKTFNVEYYEYIQILSSTLEIYMLPAALYLTAGPDVLGLLLDDILTAAMKASGVNAPWLAVNELVRAHLETPESYPNNSPTF